MVSKVRRLTTKKRCQAGCAGVITKTVTPDHQAGVLTQARVAKSRTLFHSKYRELIANMAKLQ
jgi:hypothetical protein